MPTRTSTQRREQHAPSDTAEAPLTMSITINAPATKVWDVLTDRAKRKEWFFGVDTETDWAEGSCLVHTGEYKGKPYKDKGEILEVEPDRPCVGPLVVVRAGVGEPPGHRPPVVLAQPGAGLEQPHPQARRGPGDEAPEQEPVPGDAPAAGAHGELAVGRALEGVAGPAADVAPDGGVALLPTGHVPR